MKLLIVAATKFEIAGFYEHFDLPQQDFVEHTAFDILITGVGMVATAYALGKHLSGGYNLVLNVGIAGSFDSNILLGSVVNIYSDTLTELGAEDNENFISIDELGYGKSTYITSITLPTLPKVKAITVNKVHGNATSIDKIKQEFDVQLESMEGAAVFYACERSNIPCLQVRSISNYVVPRSKGDWKIEIALHNLNEWLISFITDQIGSNVINP